MVIWVIIVIVVLIVSFFLALTSMRNYQEDQLTFWRYNSLYLAQKENLLNEVLLNEILDYLGKNGSQQVSLERLYKGEKSALVIFGPTSFFKDQMESLGLLELVDYSDKKDSESSAWEIESAQDLSNLNPDTLKPQLGSSEQFWWQVVLRPEGQKLRMVINTDNPKRLAELTSQILSIGKHQGIQLSPEDYSLVITKYRNRQFFSSPLANLIKLGFLDQKGKLQATTGQILKMVGVI